MAVTSKFNHKLQVNMTKEISDEVKRLADDQGVSYAEIIRRSIEAGLPAVRDWASENPSVRGKVSDHEFDSASETS